MPSATFRPSRCEGSRRPSDGSGVIGTVRPQHRFSTPFICLVGMATPAWKCEDSMRVLFLDSLLLKWTKDWGNEPERSREEYPWFWHGDHFTGERVNDIHLTKATKLELRKAKGERP